MCACVCPAVCVSCCGVQKSHRSMRFNTINKMRSFLQDKHKGCGEFLPVVGISALMSQDLERGSPTKELDLKLDKSRRSDWCLLLAYSFPFIYSNEPQGVERFLNKPEINLMSPFGISS